MIVHVGFGEMAELPVVGDRSERGLKRFAAQKVQYQIHAFGHHFQLYVELVVHVNEYARTWQLITTRFA